ncbi:hypothetical protein D3C72_839560 [compost metagenome]
MFDDDGRRCVVADDPTEVEPRKLAAAGRRRADDDGPVADLGRGDEARIDRRQDLRRGGRRVLPHGERILGVRLADERDAHHAGRGVIVGVQAQALYAVQDEARFGDGEGVARPDALHVGLQRDDPGNAFARIGDLKRRQLTALLCVRDEGEVQAARAGGAVFVAIGRIRDLTVQRRHLPAVRLAPEAGTKRIDPVDTTGGCVDFERTRRVGRRDHDD